MYIKFCSPSLIYEKIITLTDTGFCRNGRMAETKNITFSVLTFEDFCVIILNRHLDETNIARVLFFGGNYCRSMRPFNFIFCLFL